MKKFLLFILIIVTFSNAQAQEQEVQQLLLNLEKLAQFKAILQDMKDGYETLSQGYLVIKNLSEGNFSLHELFLDGLLKVSPAVRNYYKVTRIVTMQKQLLQAASKGFDGYAASGLFSADELTHFKRTSDLVVSKSIEHIASLASILTAGKLRMSDAERLAGIDALYDDVSEQLRFLTGFNNTTGLLALQRFKEKRDIQETKSLHGVN